MISIYEYIDRLVEYGIFNKLIFEEDIWYTRNKLIELLGLDEYKKVDLEEKEYNIEGILEGFLNFAVQKGIIGNTITEKDNFDSKVMSVLISRPSEIIREFNLKYKENPISATNFFYDLSKKSNYIRTQRVKKDLKWKTKTEYGELDITINMSKPEKDIAEIERQAKMIKGEYPKCLLCRECEGYAGTFTYPTRSNHRIIPLELNNSKWFLQYSPYVYFNEHSILLSQEHTPIKIDKNTFIDLLEFIDKFKHYFIGSNAELPIVGGSILSHNHYQGGRYQFTIENASILKSYKVKSFEDLEIKMMKWPLSTIRISSTKKENLIVIADKILEEWRNYSDSEYEIISKTDDTPHNTITPICRFKNGKYEMDLVLRNNRKSKEHIAGIFHPHSEYHHIKKENIGLIEVMGLAVLPARLNNAMNDMKDYIVSDKYTQSLEAHKDWLDSVCLKYEDINESNGLEIIRYEIGVVFKELLENCGVFKCDDKGFEGFDKFILYCLKSFS